MSRIPAYLRGHIDVAGAASLPPQLRVVLSDLAEHQTPRKTFEIAEQLGLHQDSVKYALTQLKQRGLVAHVSPAKWAISPDGVTVIDNILPKD